MEVSRRSVIGTAGAGGPPDHDVASWAGVMVPAVTPAPIVERLHAEIRDGLARPELRDRFAAVGMEVAGVRGPDASWSSCGSCGRPLGR